MTENEGFNYVRKLTEEALNSLIKLDSVTCGGYDTQERVDQAYSLIRDFLDSLPKYKPELSGQQE